MKFLRQYAHTILFSFGLVYLLYTIIGSVIELISMQMVGENLFFMVLYHLSEYMMMRYIHSVSIFWAFAFILLIVATFPKNLKSRRIEEMILLAIGFIIGYYLIMIIGQPDNQLNWSTMSYIEPISVVFLLILLLVYARKSFTMSRNQSIVLKVAFLLLALLTFIYRFIEWNLIGGNQSIWGFSIVGGSLILGILVFAFLNQEFIEVDKSNTSLVYGLLKLVGISFMVYALYFATLYRVHSLLSPYILYVPIEHDIRALLIRIAAFCFYSWIILRSISSSYDMKRTWIFTSLVLPAFWVYFSISATLVYSNYWVFNIPVYSIVLYGLLKLYNDFKLIINEKRWEIVFKKEIESKSI